ncbi:MAG: FAD-dependent oxidoreductase, partial [Actinobacteria bacterium]|nr:FAD-dependent oxidoreductase [Actinomycetota bacterium]
MSAHESVIVIGAGAGGLATAARLAAKGKSVTVLEQANFFGGKLAAYRRDGFV